MAHLSGFVGVLQVDGYAGFQALAAAKLYLGILLEPCASAFLRVAGCRSRAHRQ